MAEVWVAASVGGAVVAGYAAEQQAKDERKYNSKETRALTKDEAKYGAIESLFNAEIADYQEQMGRFRKQRGLDQFRQFSTLRSYAPEYADSARIQEPVKPNIENFNAMIDQAGISGVGAKNSPAPKPLSEVVGT